MKIVHRRGGEEHRNYNMNVVLLKIKEINVLLSLNNGLSLASNIKPRRVFGSDAYLLMHPFLSHIL